VQSRSWSRGERFGKSETGEKEKEKEGQVAKVSLLIE
jgi:hypothetical protein